MVSVFARPSLEVGGKNKDLFSYRMIQCFAEDSSYIVKIACIFHIEVKCTIVYSYATIVLLSVPLQLY